MEVVEGQRQETISDLIYELRGLECLVPIRWCDRHIRSMDPYLDGGCNPDWSDCDIVWRWLGPEIEMETR